jgi:hypothetical protein
VGNFHIGNLNASLNIEGASASLDIGSQFNIGAGAINVYDDGEFIISNSGGGAIQISLNGGAIEIDSPGFLINYSNDVVQTSTLVYVNSGGLLVNESGAHWVLNGDNGGATIGGTGTIDNYGGISEANGGVSHIAPNIVNDGTISLGNGKLWLTGKVTRKGQFIIGGGEILEFSKGVSSGQTIDFGIDGNVGTLSVVEPTAFHAKIDNFETGDTFKLLGVWEPVAVNYSGGITTLTLSHNGRDHSFYFGGEISHFNIAPEHVTSITT